MCRLFYDLRKKKRSASASGKTPADGADGPKKNIFARKVIDSKSEVWYNEARQADVAKLADAQVSGSCGRPCRFKSCHPHHVATRRILQALAEWQGLCFLRRLLLFPKNLCCANLFWEFRSWFSLRSFSLKKRGQTALAFCVFSKNQFLPIFQTFS